jgi:hypothetical protein
MENENKKRSALKLFKLFGKFKSILFTAVVTVLIMISFLLIYNNFMKNGGAYGGTVFNTQVLTGLKLNTVTYTYTDSIFIREPEEWLLFGLVDIDPGVSFLAVQYNGQITLGIDAGVDGEKIEFIRLGKDATGKTVIKAKLPDVIELTHEQFRNEEITLIQDGIFTSHEVPREKLNDAYEARKGYFSDNARALGLYDQAKESAQSQIVNLFNSIPGFKDDYVVEWR